jgi:hypothetical protein
MQTSDIYVTGSLITLLTKPVVTQRVWVMFEAVLNLHGRPLSLHFRFWKASFPDIMTLSPGDVVNASGKMIYFNQENAPLVNLVMSAWLFTGNFFTLVQKGAVQMPLNGSQPI